MKTIDFYFDFISPYAWIASTGIEALAARHGRTVTWKPFRLGVAVVKAMGLKPLLETPLKGDYIRRDVARMAKLHGIPCLSDLDTFDPVPAQRVVHAVDLRRRTTLIRTLLWARWTKGADLADPDVLMTMAAQAGIAPAQVREALADPRTRDAVQEATGEALDLGIFGSPTCVVGGELFWGVDRLPMLDRFLSDGESYLCGTDPLFPVGVL